ncbi:hypothetical protein [Pseudonocardia sp.]|uniref:hypothetical protein n=1 Tax=Pseudonocardia sp. TaxID=60912 RepID=UPI00263272BE|nr:hypothetical protein [Pseudonocardia sp.]
MSEQGTSENPEPTEPEQPDVPLNRAARRSRAKGKADAPATFGGRPRHAGPQADPTRHGRAPRPHTKRSV